MIFSILKSVVHRQHPCVKPFVTGDFDELFFPSFTVEYDCSYNYLTAFTAVLLISDTSNICHSFFNGTVSLGKIYK